jgi:hypothetical protein
MVKAGSLARRDKHYREVMKCFVTKPRQERWSREAFAPHHFCQREVLQAAIFCGTHLVVSTAMSSND